MASLADIVDYRITVDHVIDGLRKLPSKSVHSVTTSPPYYGLRDYGTAPQVWGGKPLCSHAWTTVTELKKNGKPRWPEYQQCPCGAWKGELGLEPYIELYVEHMALVMKEVYRVLRDDGTVFLNIGDSSNADMRRPLRPGRALDAKDAALIPWRLGISLQDAGWIVRQDIIWAKSGGNCPECGHRMEEGDGMPAPVRGKLVPSHEYVLLLTKTPDYYFDYVGIQQNGANRRDVLFLTSTRYDGAHYAVMSEHLAEFCVLAGVPPKSCVTCGSPWTRVVTGRSETKLERLARVEGKTKENLAPRHDGGMLQQGIHIGSFPKETIGWHPSCECSAATIPGIVLDPFSGSGTTGALALRHGRRYVGIDVDDRNLSLAKERLDKELVSRCSE